MCLRHCRIIVGGPCQDHVKILHATSWRYQLRNAKTEGTFQSLVSQGRARLIANHHWVQQWRMRIIEEWDVLDTIWEPRLVLRTKSRDVVGVGLLRLSHGH